MPVNYILFDVNRENLFPLSFTRPIAEFRVGILTLREKWEMRMQTKFSWLSDSYLAEKFPLTIGDDNILINGSIIADDGLCIAIGNLGKKESLVGECGLIAVRIDGKDIDKVSQIHEMGFNHITYPGKVLHIANLWDIFALNGKALEEDFALITQGRKSQSISTTNQVNGNENIFIEPGAKVEYSMINATSGPVYIGHEAEIMEGCLIRGPFALGAHSTLKMGARIYGATTFGPHCKVGGEVNNSVLFGYSNKAHDGFLGNSVLGEWCNLGADTNNSNLKNNYEEVKVWSYKTEHFEKTGLQFCGLIMGDHSKCGINTMFNTGTVVGVSANVFGAGFPRNFIPDFTWGGPQGMQVYTFEKAIDTANRVLTRRKLSLTEPDAKIMAHIFTVTEKYRRV
jgi:UDP-N-acetylglucosamine diphosphorylase/glucosamine-1-phosphate N-acetyltransferase